MSNKIVAGRFGGHTPLPHPHKYVHGACFRTVDDLCVRNEEKCEHECYDADAGYVCVCYDGYRLTSDQHNCSGRWHHRHHVAYPGFFVLFLFLFNPLSLGYKSALLNGVNVHNSLRIFRRVAPLSTNNSFFLSAVKFATFGNRPQTSSGYATAA